MSIKDAIAESLAVKQRLLDDDAFHTQIGEAAALCVAAFQSGAKVLLCGNGGSASDAQHIAAELSGRFYYDRPPLYAEALHVNTSFMTAVANDYTYDEVYARMVEAAGKPGDVLIGLSTSGNSPNVVKAVRKAAELGMHTIAMTGEGGGTLAAMAELSLRVPSHNTARIQEAHILVGHIICEIIESTIFPAHG